MTQEVSSRRWDRGHRVSTVHGRGEFPYRYIFLYVHKLGELALKAQPDIPHGTVTMLGDNNLGEADQGISPLVFRNLILFGTVDETYHIGILLDSSGLTQVG